MSDPEIQLRQHIQRLQNRNAELEAALRATKAAVASASDTAMKALERLAELEPLIQAAIEARHLYPSRLADLERETQCEIDRRAART